MQYRPEIDGLRAIAIIGVLLHHFLPTLTLPLTHSAEVKGYLGVDLFFVISGFLLSCYILNQQANGTFSYRAFYYRRIKRILPLTLVVLGVVSLASSAILVSTDLIDFSRSLIASLAFFANVYFWNNGGYFGTEDALKPLLHFWSLGVEEQFYLFFPLIFYTVLRVVKNVYLLMLCVALSSLACLFASVSFLDNNSAFFLLPARAWQFGLGTLSAIYYVHFHQQHRPTIAILCTTVLLTGFMVDLPTLPFNLPALPQGFLVTVAAALLLSRHVSETGPLNVVLTNPLIRAIGLISFSLYLWHWPIIALLNYIYIDDPIPYSTLFLALVATSALSIASYRIIEEPFRKRYSEKVVVRFVILGTALLLVIAVTLLKTNGLQNFEDKRVNQFAREIKSWYKCKPPTLFSSHSNWGCHIGAQNAQVTTALLGNSHAAMYAPIIDKQLRTKGQAGVVVPMLGCLPTIDLNLSQNCLSDASEILHKIVTDPKIGTVYVGTTWYLTNFVTHDGQWAQDSDHTLLAASLIRLIAQLEESGKKAFLVSPILNPHTTMSANLARKIKFRNLDDVTINQSLRKNSSDYDKRYEKAITLLESSLPAHLVRIDKNLCKDEYCYFGDANGSYFSDGTHLSAYGAQHVASAFTPTF